MDIKKSGIEMERVVFVKMKLINRDCCRFHVF